MTTTLRHYRSLVADSARWEGFVHREGDIVISTPPKCGTTWTQMICALLVFQTSDFGKPLDQISPWLDQVTKSRDDVVANLESQEHRRIIKTHTPLDGLPFDDRVTYVAVGRDPRDCALSMLHHYDNLDIEAFIKLIDSAVGIAAVADLIPTEPPKMDATPSERFWEWVDDTTPLELTVSGLAATLNHLGTFWDVRDRPNVVLLHYGEMQADLPREMRRLASRLGIDLSDDAVSRLADAASFDEMRKHASDVAPNATEPIWRDTEQFFHRGTSGQWHNAIATPDDVRRYAARVAELATPDLSQWAHQGPIEP